MATAIEYGLIAAGISVAIVATVNGFGSNLSSRSESYTYDRPSIVEGVQQTMPAVDFVPGLQNLKFVTAGYKKLTWVWGQRHVTYGNEIIAACGNPTVDWVDRRPQYPDHNWRAGGYNVTCH